MAGLGSVSNSIAIHVTAAPLFYNGRVDVDPDDQQHRPVWAFATTPGTNMKLKFILPLLLMGVTSVSLAQSITDSQGFLWDIQANGSIMDGSSDTFDGAYTLYVNGTSFDGMAPKQTKGVYSYGPVNVAGVNVTRHIMMTTDPPGLVYVDSFENPGGNAIDVTPMNYSNMGEHGTVQPVQSKKGGVQSYLYPQMNGRSSVTVLFGEKSTRYLPTVTANGDEITVNYPQFKLPARQTKSIAYFVGQRATGSGADLRDSKRAFTKAVREILTKKRFTLLNMSGMSIFSIGDIDLVAQGDMDYIETIGGDKVYGNLSTTEFTLDTVLGKRKLAVDQIVNIIGMENGRKFQVISNDGSALTGKLEPSAVQFGLSDGGNGEISLDEIERLVPKLPEALRSKDPKEREKWFKFGQPLFVFKNDDRIAGEILNKDVSIHTSIGELSLPLEALRSIELNQDDGALNTATFTTKDGQVFTGVFYEPMEIKVWTDKSIKVSPGNLKTIFLQGISDENSVAAEIPTKKSYLKLTDSEFLFATIKTTEKPLEFQTAFGVRTMNPEQIALLENVPGISGEMKIQLWDGSSLTGKLTADKILFDILGRDMELSPAMVRNFSNPNAVPPESLRQKYVDLIKQLGSPTFAERESAFERLEKDAEKIKGLLETHLEDAANAETRARILKLLGRQDEEEKEEKKEGEAEGEGGDEQAVDPPDLVPPLAETDLRKFKGFDNEGWK